MTADAARARLLSVRVAVSGAAGRLGRLTTARLLERVPASDIVLLTRDPTALGDATAEVRRADFDEPAGLAAALAGVERLLLVSTSAVGRRTPQHRTAIEGARAAGVGHVVYTSLPNPSPENPALVTHEHAETEGLLRDSGLDWTVLRNGLYAEDQLGPAGEALTTGTLTDNRGDGRAAFVTRADCAAAAAAVLAGEGHAGRVYDVDGPALLSSADIAVVVAELRGAPVEHRSLSDEDFAARLRAAGTMTEQRVAITVSMGRSIREGWMAVAGADMARLTGAPPRPVRAVLADHLA